MKNGGRLPSQKIKSTVEFILSDSRRAVINYSPCFYSLIVFVNRSAYLLNLVTPVPEGNVQWTFN